jgi:hypothetical protein
MGILLFGCRWSWGIVVAGAVRRKVGAWQVLIHRSGELGWRSLLADA